MKPSLSSLSARLDDMEKRVAALEAPADQTDTLAFGSASCTINGNTSPDSKLLVQRRINLYHRLHDSPSLSAYNFRIPSDGWREGYRPDRLLYAENPEGDVWELQKVPDHPELTGEQLFTWKAAMRETKKAGKRMPTDEEFSQILKKKSDMPNLLFAGYRDADGSLVDQSTNAFFWSSTESESGAWYRLLDSVQTDVLRDTPDQAFGFSVRCLKD